MAIKIASVRYISTAVRDLVAPHYQCRGTMKVWLALCAAVFVVGFPSLGTRLNGQTPSRGRVLVHDVALGAIDRGLRLYDAPRPLGALQLDRSLFDAAGRTDSPYVNDRVLVKFRAGVAEVARALTAQRAGGAVLSRPSYADFEIVPE